MAKTNIEWTDVMWNLEKSLSKPLRWRKPRMVFVNSTSDLFHQSVSFEFLARIFNVMADARCEKHTFWVLTKRMARVFEFLDWVENHKSGDTPLTGALEVHGAVPNVLIGPSIEDQKTCNERLPDAMRLAQLGWRTMLSVEPLLGPVDFAEADEEWWESAYVPSWVIVGGESGPQARPMHPDWVRSIRDQCAANGVPFFFKQWGEWAPIADHHVLCRRKDGGNYGHLPDGSRIYESDRRELHIWNHREVNTDDCFSALRVGKKQAGRLLDGREYNEMPI